MGMPDEYRLLSVRAKRAVQITLLSRPKTGIVSAILSTANLTSATRRSACTAITSTTTAITTTYHRVVMKSLAAMSASVVAGSESMFANRSLNCGRTKVTRMITTATARMPRIIG